MKNWHNNGIIVNGILMNLSLSYKMGTSWEWEKYEKRGVSIVVMLLIIQIVTSIFQIVKYLYYILVYNVS